MSASSYTLSAVSGSFTSRDLGKYGVAVDWTAGNTTSGCWPGYACFAGVACSFTVTSVPDSSSITVTPISGCGSSGIGFSTSGKGYWAVYTDDTAALQNALIAAADAGNTLYVPAAYKGGIFGATDVNVPSNSTIQCASGATFNNPNLTYAGSKILMLGGSNTTISGCTFGGTEPTNGAWYDVNREYDVAISVFGGDNVSITGNTFQNLWGTYALGTSPATNISISNNAFTNLAYYGVQLAECGGSPGCSVTNNTFIDSNYGSEDGGSWPAGTDIESIKNNTMYPANGGSGYHRSQTSFGLYTYGSVFMDSGSACSGPACSSNQYSGVDMEYNDVWGATSAILQSPYGGTVMNNTCVSGCSYR